MFEAFPRLGETLVWETVTGGYVLDDLSDQQVATFRALNDRDVLYALEALQELGAARGGDQGTVEPTELALWALGRASQAPAPGDPMLQIRVTWPGLEDYHLHTFSDGRVRYGRSDPELRLQDERKATAADLLPRRGSRARYTYDFGDDWEHEVVLEERPAAEPDVACPVCVAGEGACPPEDFGGPWGLRAPARGRRRPHQRRARGHVGMAGTGQGNRLRPHPVRPERRQSCPQRRGLTYGRT